MFSIGIEQRVGELGPNDFPELYERTSHDSSVDFGLIRGAVDLHQLYEDAPELTCSTGITTEQTSIALRSQIRYISVLDTLADNIAAEVYSRPVFPIRHTNQVTDRRIDDRRSTQGFHPDRPNTLAVISFDTTTDSDSTEPSAYAYGIRMLPSVPPQPFCDRRSVLLEYLAMLREANNPTSLLDRSMVPIYPGDALVIPRGVLHYVKAASPERTALVTTTKVVWPLNF